MRYFGDIKKLQGIDNGYRLRVGDLRVLFSIKDDRIYIDNIIPRGQAYKRLQEQVKEYEQRDVKKFDKQGNKRDDTT